MKIALGSDHGGFDLKEHIKTTIEKLGHEVIDVGCFGSESVDYPDYGFQASQLVSEKNAERAVLFCKSGIGMSIVANKVLDVRGSLCLNEEMAEFSRSHNDANVLILPANFLNEQKADNILKKWLITEFEGGRHIRRINKISEFERKKN